MCLLNQQRLNDSHKRRAEDGYTYTPTSTTHLGLFWDSRLTLNL